MIFWGTIALVTFIAWKLSQGRKGQKAITVGAALACAVLLYAAALPVTLTASGSGSVPAASSR